MVSLVILAVMILFLPFAIRASTKRRESSRGLRWQRIRWSPPDDAEATVARAVDKQKAGDLPGAIALYDRMLAEQRTALVLNNRGCALLEAGQVERALSDLREAVAIEPGRATAHCSLAEALARVGDHAAALASLKRAAELDPSWRTYAKTAAAFEELRKTEEAGRWVAGE